MMGMITALLVALALPAPIQASALTPQATVRNPASLGPIISFASPLELSKRYGGSSILWRVDVAVPAGLALAPVDSPGDQPILFAFNGDRCFELKLDAKLNTLEQAEFTPTSCTRLRHPDLAVPELVPAAARELTYVGHSWNLTAWKDPSGKRTLIFQDGHPEQPVLTTRMNVQAIGAIGSPDLPLTRLSLIGAVDGQLVVATVQLVIP